jgi:hypothetical protein
MSTVEIALEKVRQLDEAHARLLLDWLQSQAATNVPPGEPQGAMAMLGFARRIRPEPRTTADWMTELRAGEACLTLRP